MTILEILRRDHEEILELLARLEGISQDRMEERREIFEEFTRALLGHARAERATYYCRLEGNFDLPQRAMEALEEHLVLERILDELSDMEVSEEEWLTKFEIFKENVEDHFENEERVTFPLSKDVLGKEELELIATEYLREKERLLEEWV